MKRWRDAAARGEANSDEEFAAGLLADLPVLPDSSARMARVAAKLASPAVAPRPFGRRLAWAASLALIVLASTAAVAAIGRGLLTRRRAAVVAPVERPSLPRQDWPRVPVGGTPPAPLSQPPHAPIAIPIPGALPVERSPHAPIATPIPGALPVERSPHAPIATPIPGAFPVERSPHARPLRSAPAVDDAAIAGAPIPPIAATRSGGDPPRADHGAKLPVDDEEDEVAARVEARLPPADAPAAAGAALLVHAVVALQKNGDPSTTVALCADYLRRYPDGPLVEEALVLTVEAEAHRDEWARAAAAAADYRRRFPSGRYRAACDRALRRSDRRGD